MKFHDCVLKTFAHATIDPSFIVFLISVIKCLNP